MTAASEQWTITKPALVSRRGVVAAQHVLAARAGVSCLSAGGNAVDAAIATALALQCVEPWMSGLTASGYLLVAGPQLPGVTAVEFSGVAPLALTPDDYPIDPSVPPTFLGFPGVTGNRLVVGWQAVAVPGAVAGLAAAHERWGRLAWPELVAPAIALADGGMAVDWHATLAIAMAMPDLARDTAAAAWLLPGGAPPEPGRRLPLPTLARTLRRLAEDGPADFYEGRLAADWIADARAGGSCLSLDDLAAYRPRIVEATSQTHGGAVLHVVPDVSGGGRLLDAMALVDARLPGSSEPSAILDALADGLDRAFSRHQRRLAGPREGSTTHISVVDATGMMVSLTFTLLNRFGARVVSPSTGLMMNNGLSWFDPRPGRLNSLSPGARALTNMCPTIVTRAGRPILAVGASGGSQIVPAVAQVIALWLQGGLNLEQAMHHPRLDATGGGTVRLDPELPEALKHSLAQRFRTVEVPRTVFPRPFAAPGAVARDPAGINSALADITYPMAGMAEGG
ncbi:MAG: gamma-glutamyltransferase [Alphaproteobacteria bacterium]|nr:gamma-glutamyltransferase [Alphaproteobacteria bacterium]